MNHQIVGNVGNNTDNGGNMRAVLIPETLCKKIEAAIENESELVDETTVLRKFRLTKKTLCNYISSKKIPRGYYTIAFNKSRWFFINKLLGLKNIISNRRAA